VKELLENGIIEESNSLQSSPAMLVKKANNTFRLVLDLRKANLGKANLLPPDFFITCHRSIII